MKAIWMAAAALGLHGVAHGQERNGLEFDGVYVGISFSTQNIIGGALVGGTDVLAQQTRPAIDLVVGWRTTVGDGFVLGLEAGVGGESGNLQVSNSSGQIDWENNFHWRFGGLAGYRFKDGPLLFTYLHETKRDFDVRLTSGAATATQKDSQGLLRFGVGAEFGIGDDNTMRLSAGTSRADFGGRPTSIKPDHPVEFEAAVLRQF